MKNVRLILLMKKAINRISKCKSIVILLSIFMLLFSTCINKKPKIITVLSLLNNSSSNSATTFSVGGNISGVSGSGLVIQNNGADNTSVSANGTFTFSTSLTDGASYSVSVLTNPSSPSQVCTVTNGTGTIQSSNVSNVIITCTTSLAVSYAGSPYSYTVNIAITTNTPTLTGNPTSCSASPILPTGLTINNTTCAITGTPTVTQSATTHIITATNSIASATASINITVAAVATAPSALTYSSSAYTMQRNVAITTITPSVTGTVTSCSSSPTLPTGLSINNTTCAISGTPTTNQGSTSYTITASNSGGNTTATLSITVSTTVFRIFVTANAYNGDLKTAGGGGNGPAGADNLCNADANKPNSSSYKAILFANGIRTASPTSNWVLQATTTYIRGSDSATIFTTNASSIFTFGTLTNSFAVGTQKEYWTGFRGAGNEWELGLYRCDEWKNGTSSETGRFGLSDSTSYNSISTGTQNNCNLTKYLLCAEQ